MARRGDLPNVCQSIVALSKAAEHLVHSKNVYAEMKLDLSGQW